MAAAKPLKPQSPVTVFLKTARIWMINPPSSPKTPCFKLFTLLKCNACYLLCLWHWTSTIVTKTTTTTLITLRAISLAFPVDDCTSSLSFSRILFVNWSSFMDWLWFFSLETFTKKLSFTSISFLWFFTRVRFGNFVWLFERVWPVNLVPFLNCGVHCFFGGMPSLTHFSTLLTFLPLPQKKHGWQGFILLFVQKYPFTQVPLHSVVSSSGVHFPSNFSLG